MDKFIILEDNAEVRTNLLPITYLRPVSALRVGVDTIAEKWHRLVQAHYSVDTALYLRQKYGEPASVEEAWHVASNVVPDGDLAARVMELEPDQALYAGDLRVAWRGNGTVRREFYGDVAVVNYAYDIFGLNDRVLRSAFAALTAGRTSRQPSPSVTVIGDRSQLFIHPDAGDVEGCIINVKTGPVYIGPGAEVMEGACLRGPVALCSQSVIKMGARIYGATTIGPHCKVGGEVQNTVMMAYSNKAHDGFLGNAVICEWCNIGAGCVASNLKNDYTPIRLWNYTQRRFMRTDLQFCGLIMGDHSKAGVNTMFNTATVLGIGVNIHGSGFPRPFVASFLEGSTIGYNDVPMAKFFDTARRMMARRDIELTEADVNILNYIRQYSEDYR